MNNSESDSDDFFSEIRALRQKFGLSKAKAKTKIPAHTPTRDQPNATTYSTHSNSPAPTMPIVPKQAAPVPATTLHNPTKLSGSNSKNITPGELAALLLPRNTKRHKANRRTSTGITVPPVRTPESEIVNAQSPLFRTSLHIVSPALSSPASPLWSPIRRPFELQGSPTPTTTSAAAAAGSLAVAGEESADMVFDLASLDASESAIGPLGDLEETMMTERNLDQARLKLGQLQAETEQQIIKDLRDRLVGYTAEVEFPAAAVACKWWSSVLLCQLRTMGHGELAFSDQAVVWRGQIIGPIKPVGEVASVVDSAGDGASGGGQMEDVVLEFPWLKVTALRRKSIDNDEFIMVTVDEDMAVAFQITTLRLSENIDQRVADMSAQISRTLKHRAQKQQQQKQEHQQCDLLPDTLRETATLVESLLRLASRHSDQQFSTLNIERTMAAPDFLKVASDLTSQFSRRLGTLALEHQLADEDSGTETLPGTCTLCYTTFEAIVLSPCDHRLCETCFLKLRQDLPQLSQPTEDPLSDSVVCICPWDRILITEWTTLLKM
ncbi:hypothetical protein BX661DRAFT_176113 [Kickxella alabastrina]|uniref:uncharacterized protein n=1 Tax=Kickxella alabastrina TaxID=61397 RepID=UPI002220DD29|nr:uncharacterized protein BX661DRAFT_176113 [Kickxella alabastrina]KAI7835119.1 hypothetical protein BX661DRAFT_176113 [Kickxella alabastrina]